MIKVQRILFLSLLLQVYAGCATPVQSAGSPKTPQAEHGVSQAQDCHQDALSQPYPLLRQTLVGAGIAPEQLRCNTRVVWAKNLKKYADGIVAEIAQTWDVSPTSQKLKQAQRTALGYLVRSAFEETNMQNLGVMRLKGHTYRDAQAKEHPLLVFRSSLIVAPDAASECVESLLEHGHVRHVINLYAGSFPFRDLIEREKLFVHQHDATYYDDGEPHSATVSWRKLVEDKDRYASNREQAQRLLAQLIREQVLRPGGKEPRGNIYLHCGGGMHRSGMIFGVMRRCINGDPWDKIRAEYAHHVGWISDKQPGGFEELNLRFIKEFDCSLLSQPGVSGPKTAGN